MPSDASLTPDAIVIGGGMAGMAVSMHLAKAGLRVTCIEPESGDRQPVGESLDWATPDLLNALGFSRDYLLTNISTYKRHVTLQMGTASRVQYAVSPWLAEAPYKVELNTLHADRLRLDRELRERVEGLGVKVVQDRVVSVERDGRRIAALRSANGERYVARWYVDCSGGATSLLAREFRLPFSQYGPRKVALWSYFTVGTPSEGTTIYSEATPAKYLEWVWEIPITASTVSVGCISPGESLKLERAAGLTVVDIFRGQLAKFPRFEPLLAETPGEVHVTSFQCRSYKGVTGPNWIIAGEAASLVDPVTSNGVSAALRHAEDAAALIVAARKRATLPRWGCALYRLRVWEMGRFFNSGIEKLVYDWPLRDRLGLARAADIYTSAAWSANTLYSRFRPRKTARTLAFVSLLSVLRMCAWVMRRTQGSMRPGYQEN
jgi:menaquinone-9 beta-reductase